MDLLMLMRDFDWNQTGASAQVLRELEQVLGLSLPEDYVQLMKRSNGAEGFVNGRFLQLWRVEDILSRRHRYEPHEEQAALLFFGSGENERSYAFDPSAAPLVAVMDVPADESEMRCLGYSLTSLVEHLAH